MASLMKKWFNIYDKFTNFLSLCGYWVGMVLLAIMLVGNAFEVVSRYFFNRSTGIMDEALIYCNIGIIFLALGWAWKTKAHIYVELVIDRLHGWWHTGVYLGGLVISLVTLIGLLVSAYLYERSVIESGLRAYTVWGVPRWIPMLIVCLGLFIFLLEVIMTLVKETKSNFSKRSERKDHSI